MEYCFAWQQNQVGRYICKAITDKCDGKNKDCPFYKTNEQHQEEVRNAYTRIATLPEWQQKSISDNCYGGDMPWREYTQKREDIQHDIITDVIGVV